MDRVTKKDVRSLARELREVARALDWALRSEREEWREDVCEIIEQWAVPTAATLQGRLEEEGVEY